MMNQKLKVLSLFSGVGMMDYGLEQTGGFETTVFCEIDKDCQKVLRKHWSEVRIFNNVSTLHYINYPKGQYDKPDVICGGFPCQDISVAGKQKGMIDEETGEQTRSGLWFEYARIIKEVKPKWVIIENVSNLRNKGLATIIQDLHEIGYDCCWENISAKSVGAYHKRERIWIVAYSMQSRLEKQCKSIGVSKEQPSSECGSYESSNTDNFRFWPPFTSEEEKSQWWTKTTSRFSSVFEQITEIEPTICRGNDGPSLGLDTDKRRNQIIRRLEQLRKARIKQLGNGLIPQIAQIIGERILHHENSRQSD